MPWYVWFGVLTGSWVSLSIAVTLLAGRLIRMLGEDHEG